MVDLVPGESEVPFAPQSGISTIGAYSRRGPIVRAKKSNNSSPGSGRLPCRTELNLDVTRAVLTNAWGGATAISHVNSLCHGSEVF
jgi:hypothetical protein